MKDIIKNGFVFIGLLASIIIVSFSSCSDEESYDFPGDYVNRVYLKKCSLSYQFVHTPVTSMSTLNFRMPVYTTLKATGLIKATIEVDNTLLETYNSLNGKKFKSIPDKALVIENGIMTIPAGEMYSSDSIHITINESVLPELRDEQGYLIPLKLTTVEGENAVASTNVNQMYLTVTTTVDNDMIRDDVTDGDVQGKWVDERVGWTASVVESANVTVKGEASNMFDGDKKTEWEVTANESFSFIVDMQEEYDATAVSAYYSSYRDYASLTKEFKIETSKDSAEWADIGIVPNVGWSRKIVIFNAPIKARYFRITVPATPDWWGNKSASLKVGEFSIYVK